MDRDRDRDRRDDRHYSNTYRPRSPPPRIDSYRANRSPVRGRGDRGERGDRGDRGDRGLIAADTYTPGGRASRPRSRSPRPRSPPFRRRTRSPRREDDRWRARPRSPPRRTFSPRRDDFRGGRARSPRRDEYDSYTRSPRVRDRSPPPRERDPSPAPSRGMRSPLRASRYEAPRSRAHSPLRRFSPAPARDTRDTRDNRRRSPSPRRERADPYTADTWRRRSPSPAANAYANNADVSNDVSGRQSAATSRRSSPPLVHPSRAALVQEDIPMRDAPAPRSPFRERESRNRETPRERGDTLPRERERERERSPPRHRDTPPTGPRSDRDREREFAPPSGPSSYRNGNNHFDRAPPTGPSGRGYQGSPVPSAPTGPASTISQPPSFPRGNSNPVLAAPTHPSGRGRGGRGGFGYDAPRDFSGPAPGRRGSAHWGPRGGGGFYAGPPAGPRGVISGPGPFPPAFRGSSNSTSTTYPRTQTFRNHLADLPKEIPGGQRAPELMDKSKQLKLEEEIKKMREVIAAKEASKRQTVKEWDTLNREGENAALKVELAEQHLRNLNGESEGGAAF